MGQKNIKPIDGLMIFKIRDKEFCIETGQSYKIITSLWSDEFLKARYILMYDRRMYSYIPLDKVFGIELNTKSKISVILLDNIFNYNNGYLLVDEITDFVSLSDTHKNIKISDSDNPYVKLEIEFGERFIKMPNLKLASMYYLKN